MISSGIHYIVQTFQARRNHLVCCETMACGPMAPNSFPDLLENTWPGMPQWSTTALHHTCRRQQSQQVLKLSRLRFVSLKNMHLGWVAGNPCVCPHCLRKSWACK